MPIFNDSDSEVDENDNSDDDNLTRIVEQILAGLMILEMAVIGGHSTVTSLSTEDSCTTIKKRFNYSFFHTIVDP